MIDATAKPPLYVSTEGTVGPYIKLPLSRLDEVRQLLDRHQVSYYVEEDVVSFNGGPEIAVIDLGRGADARSVQAILDRIR